MRTSPTSHFKAGFVALSFLASASAVAADEFDRYIADVAILQAKAVQTELKITDAIRAAMNKHAVWLDTQGANIDRLVRARTITVAEGNRRTKLHLATLKSKVLRELSAAQVKRLREITLQRDGLAPLMDKRVSDKIGMTAAQLKRIRDAYVANDNKAKQIQKAAFSPIFEKYGNMKPKSDAEKKQFEDQANKELDIEKKRIRPQLEMLGKEFEALVAGTLTKGQKDAFNRLKGAPFKPKIEG
ncbi:MAG: hypothetical protein IH945_13150 [Armatimonadetes bacterium]|nr:hypothetical protein [Armatimonadota bacterium]